MSVFEHTDPDYIEVIEDGMCVRPTCIQPMFALKDDTYPGSPMRVTSADYQHPQGQLL